MSDDRKEILARRARMVAAALTGVGLGVSAVHCDRNPDAPPDASPPEPRASVEAPATSATASAPATASSTASASATADALDAGVDAGVDASADASVGAKVPRLDAGAKATNATPTRPHPCLSPPVRRPRICLDFAF